MALTTIRRLFLQPTRVSLSTKLTSPSSLYRSRAAALGEKLEPLGRWAKRIEPSGKNHVKRSHWKLCVQRCYANIFCKSGMKFGMRSLVGLSAAFGAISLGPHIAYAMNGFDIVGDDDREGFLPTDAEEHPPDILILARKLLPPAFLFITLLMNWGHPIILVAKIILILFGTKPRPLSVYLFVEQLRKQFIHQHPVIYKFKSLYAKKVEVDDYKFLCLARVELNGQEFTLIGILGSWWVLPRSNNSGSNLTPRNTFLQNYLRN